MLQKVEIEKRFLFSLFNNFNKSKFGQLTKNYDLKNYFYTQ